MNQFIDVTGGALLTSFTPIDTSNFLKVARANALYVNEAGEDIDMRNNRITNVLYR